MNNFYLTSELIIAIDNHRNFRSWKNATRSDSQIQRYYRAIHRDCSRNTVLFCRLYCNIYSCSNNFAIMRSLRNSPVQKLHRVTAALYNACNFFTWVEVFRKFEGQLRVFQPNLLFILSIQIRAYVTRYVICPICPFSTFHPRISRNYVTSYVKLG